MDTWNRNLSFSFYRLSRSLFDRLLFPERVRAPMSSFLPTYDRQTATCPCVSCPPVCPFLHPFAEHPTFHASARVQVATLVPEEQLANRMEFPGNLCNMEPHTAWPSAIPFDGTWLKRVVLSRATVLVSSWGTTEYEACVSWSGWIVTWNERYSR